MKTPLTTSDFVAEISYIEEMIAREMWEAMQQKDEEQADLYDKNCVWRLFS